MVAVITGNTLGVTTGSGSVLGNGGQLGSTATGRGGDQATVNAKTGNLTLQVQDELLVGRGPDIGIVRTYNSNASFDCDNNDGWQLSLYRKLGSLTGIVNTAGSTIKRYGADGSQATYTYNASLGYYTNQDGGGAYDSLSYNSSTDTWTWADGDTQIAETYAAGPSVGEWRITAQGDLDGNALTYSYDANGLITQVTDANGDFTRLNYDTTTRQLISIEVAAGNVTTTRIRYTYDPAGRLASVSTDLTPEDGSIADGKAYTTTYSYDGASTRIASLVNSDGTGVSFSYDASQRVETVTDGAGKITRFAYGSGSTSVTDSLGQTSTLYYDANGNLIRLQGPVGSGQDVQYAYNASGDLTMLWDSRDNIVRYSYDAHGNRIRQQDSAGNVVERAFDGANQLVRETTFAVADPDQWGTQQASAPQTTYYVRDAKQHLRFTVSPEGRVTEYRYNGRGQQTSSLTYTAATFNSVSLAAWAQDFSVDTSGLTPTTLPAAFARVGNALQVTSTNQAATDFPTVTGAQLPMGTIWRAEVTTPATLSVGQLYLGVDSGTYGTADYRRLIASFSTVSTSFTNQGSTSTSRTLGNLKSNTTYVVEVVTEVDGLVTLYLYEKGNNRSNGFVEQNQFIANQPASLVMQTYWGSTAAGGTAGTTNSILVDNLSTQLQPREADLAIWAASQDLTHLQRTDYAYNVRGQLMATTTYAATDSTGAGIAGSEAGSIYFYDAAGRLLRQYDDTGPAGASAMAKTAYTYDGLGRVLTKQDALGNLTTTVYNDAGHSVAVTEANGLTKIATYDGRGQLVSQIDRDAATILSSVTYQYDADGRLRVTTDPNGNKSYLLYDPAGRKVGEIDGAGSLTEIIYNNNGQVTKTLRYANAVAANLATLFAADATGTIPNVALADVRPTATSTDIVSRKIYDAAGRLRFSIDGMGYVTETRYDGVGRVLTTIAYDYVAANVAGLDSLGREADPSDIQLLTTVVIGSQIGLPVHPGYDRVTRNFYDADGLLRGTLDGEGYLTEHRYDAAGRLTQTVRYFRLTTAADRAAGTLATLIASANTVPANNIQNFAWYNGFGQLIGSLDGEGYYTTYQYDFAGNRTATTRFTNRLVGNAAVGSAPTVVDTPPGSVPIGGYVLTNTLDQTTRRIWTKLHQLASETAVNGTVTQYSYDAAGHLVRTVVAQGATDSRTQQARYDLQGRLVQELSALGSAALATQVNPTQAQIDAIWTAYGSTYAYDAAGRRIKSTDANGNVTLFFYDTGNRLTYSVRQVKNPAKADEWVGEVNGRTYNALGQVTAEVQYANRIIASRLATLTGGSDTPVASGSVLVTSVNDSRTSYTYTARGELQFALTQISSTELTQSTSSYDAFGELVVLTTRSNTDLTRHNEQFAFDRRGLLKTKSVWNSSPGTIGSRWTSRWTYDAFGRAVTNTDGRGIVSTTTYDKLGRQVQTVSAAGALNISRSTTYDAFGRVLTQTDALGNVTTFGYAIDTVTGQTTLTVTSPENIVTRTVTDRYGQTLVVVDGQGNETRSAYDANGNLLTVKRWDKTANVETPVSINSYDAAGLRLLQTQDANGNAVAYTYDAANRLLTRTVDPTGLHLVTTYGYDAKGQTISVTDPNGVVTQTTYDLAGRAVMVAVDPTGLNLRTRYTYDFAGNQLTVVEGYGTTEARTTQYGYDNLGRRIQQIVDPNGIKLVTTYAYDENGNLTTKVEAAGTSLARTTRYSYDAANRLVYTIDALGSVVKNDYDAQGHLIQSTAYANAVSLVSLALNPALADVAALVVVDATRDRVTRFAFDKDGRQRFAIDALGAVTETRYDAAGNVARRIAYANGLTGAYTTGSLPTVGASGCNVQTSADDRVTVYGYDAFNRLTSRTEAYGTPVARTETWGYDLAGNAIRHTDGRTNSEWFAYDRANRQIRHIDQGGYVTDTEWYADGRKKAEKRWMNAVALPAAADDRWAYAGHAANPVANPDPVSGDRTTSFTYDQAGRTETRSDATGTKTRYTYDALGNVIDTIVADNTFTPTFLHRTYDKVGRVLTETRAYYTTDASTTRYEYDAQGNQTTIVVADGTAVARTTVQDFDVLGRKTAVKDGSNVTTSTTYNAFGDIVKVTDANDNSGYFYTDALGRVTLQVDPEGSVTQTIYSLWGDTTDVVRYANKIVGAVSETTTPQILSAAGNDVYVVTNSAADQHQQTLYDALGRKSEIHTWWGPNAADFYTEKLTYDGNGNTLTLLGRNGAVTTYEYDKDNHKIREVLPVTSKNASGGATAVENRFAYDAQGNLITKIEAYGLPEQRITTYAYDKLNRQVKEIGETINTFDPVSQANVGVAPVKQRIYDVRSNLVEEVDAKGNRTIHQYDNQDREVVRIDADGYATQWTFDAAGNMTSQTAHGTWCGIPTDPTSPISPYSNPSIDRVVYYSYDGVGRPTGTRIDNVTTGRYNPNLAGGQVEIITGSITTANKYDAMGNVVKAIDSNGNVTRFYYNKAGQKVGQLDALGYLTAWTYDSLGNTEKQTQSANAVSPSLAITDSTTLAELQSNLKPSADDRITTYTYDKLGRTLSESRLNVASGTVNASTGVLTEATGTLPAATTRYVYDGLNNITRKTDAANAVTDWSYDGLGRKTREQKSGYVDYQGATVRPTTDYEYDGLNQVKREILRGTDNAVETDDRITSYTYGAGGYLSSQTDAAGAVTQFRIDANGNVTMKTLLGRLDADGNAVNDVTRYEYDVRNRQVKSTDVATGTTQETLYNCFGEVTAKRTNGPGSSRYLQNQWDEWNEYDRTGRLWRTNAGDGVTRVYVYDAAGNATLQIRPNQPGLSFYDINQATVLAGTYDGKTISRYDARNQLTETISDGPVTAHRYQVVNAFGEVIQEIDALGRVTDLKYNTFGKLIEKRDPQTNVTLANGFVDRLRPTTRYVYDLTGRLLATVDPNGNAATQSWLPGGGDSQIVLESHFDNAGRFYGSDRAGYDIFDDKRFDQDALGNRTDFQYDKLGRLTQVKHPQRAAGTPGNDGAAPIQAIDQYAYDAAGHRISHTNALGNTEKTYFDSLSRVVATKTFNGFTTSYSYSWIRESEKIDGFGINWTGLGSGFRGGWATKTTDAVGRTTIDVQDVFGYQVFHKDQGQDSAAGTTRYGYDNLGRLSWKRVSKSPQASLLRSSSVAYTYYSNGLLKSALDQMDSGYAIKVPDPTYAYYEYDAAGNRTVERLARLTDAANTSSVAEYYQNSSMEYDELNRVIHVADSTKFDIRYEYDANGNRRRALANYDASVTGTAATQDYWYKYDALNRFVVTQGTLSSGARGTSANDSSVSIVRGSTGVDVAYDTIGQRRQAINGSDGTVEEYTYSADGVLEDIKINGLLRSRRKTDLLGQVRFYNEWDNSGTQTLVRYTVYDKDGRVLTQKGTEGTVTYLYFIGATDNTSPPPFPNSQTVSETGAGALAYKGILKSGVGFDYYYAYDYFDTAKVHWVRLLTDLASRFINSETYYDPQGRIMEFDDAGGDQILGTRDDRIINYVTDQNGQVIRRVETEAGVQKGTHSYFFANGVVIGDAGTDGVGQTDYAQSLALREAHSKSGTEAAANFDANYTPITPSTASGTGYSSYTIRDGETLQSIARSVWGDAGLWYLIADANGLTATDPLYANQVIVIPDRVTNIANSASTFRPYNAGAAIGDTNPTIPEPPPPPAAPKEARCGVAQIIIAIVVVVVAYYTGYYAGTELGWSTAAAGAAGGAAGSVAGQVLAMGFGLQDKFSWRAVAAGAITGAATAGLGEISALKEYPVLMAVASNVVNQTVNMALKLQHGFNWKSVAVSAISAGITQSINQKLFADGGVLGKNGLLSSWVDTRLTENLARSTVGALVSASTRLAVQHGHVEWESVAADALSSTAGSMARSQNVAARNEFGRTKAQQADYDEALRDKENATLLNWTPADTGAQQEAAARYAPPEGGRGNAGTGSSSDMPDIEGYATLKDLRHSAYIGGSGEDPELLPGPSMIPKSARPMTAEGYDVASGVSGPGQLAAALGSADEANSIYRTFSLPADLPDEQRTKLQAYLDENHQLQDSSKLGEFSRAAAEFGLKLAPHDNGIINSYWQSIGQGTMWATAERVVAVNIYNPTASMGADAVQTGLQVMFGLNDATVSASRLVIDEAVKLNTDNFGAEAYTPVYAHSQGTAIANEAVAGLDKDIQGRINLYNVGTATGKVPGYVHSYHSVINSLDSTPMIVGMIAGLGGGGTSPGFLQGTGAGRDYQVVTTTFDVANDHFNHSLPYYFSDSTARSALGIGSLSPALVTMMKNAPWIQQ